MPGMMRWSCSYGCCIRGSRRHDKQVTRRWRDEYETRPEIEARACPKGGPECGCWRWQPGETDTETPTHGVYAVGE